MKVPEFIRNLARLPWQGAVTPETYQRLTLRLYLATLVMFSFIALVSLALAALVMLVLSMGVPLWIILPVGIFKVLLKGLLWGGIALIGIWTFFIGIKLSILRLRSLGFRNKGAVTFILTMFLINCICMAASFLYVEPAYLVGLGIPLGVWLVLPYLALSQMILALMRYWICFEEKPLRPHTVQQLQPLTKAPDRFESLCLFLLQIYFWLGILWAPLSAITNY